MEMVWHDNKFMQLIFFLRSVVQHDFNQQRSNLFYMEERFSFKDIGSDKVGGLCCGSSMRDRQNGPQRLKPEFIVACRKPEGLLHPVEPKKYL